MRPTRLSGPRSIISVGLGGAISTGGSGSFSDPDDWYESTTIEEALAEAASKMWGYQAHGLLGSTETFDAEGGWHSGTLNANCTFTLIANASGTASSLFLELLQDGTGGWTITLPSSVVNKAELEAAQDTTPDETTFLVLLTRDGGATWYGGWWGGAVITDHDDLTNVTADQHHNQVHVLTGSDHTVSGLTTGHVLTATSATTFAFAAAAGTSASDANIWRPLMDGAGNVITDGTGQAVMAYGPA